MAALSSRVTVSADRRAGLPPTGGTPSRLNQVHRAFLEIHPVELPKFTKTAEQLSDALDGWCYFLRHGQIANGSQ